MPARMFTSAHPPLCPDQPERTCMNMNKEIYERTELDIIKFQTADVIMTSGEADELPIVTQPQS